MEEERRARERDRFRQLKLERKQLRDSSNPFSLGSDYFKRYYRMSPEMAIQLINLLENHLITERNSAVPPHLQVLITLRFLAEGAFQKGFAQDKEHPISQTTASRILEKVLISINEIGRLFIQMPLTAEARHNIQQGFMEKIRIPGIIGLVDGFLVKFRRPTENEEAFFNYKEKHSMNVQIIVNHAYEILNIRICPGSNNDRHVWNFSHAKRFLESLRANIEILEREGRFYILADSGYTLSPTLLTPILYAPEGTPSALYTSEHVATRCHVEQTIGVLTNRWMAINRGRKLNYSVQKVCLIINACAILHNFIIRNGVVHDEAHNQPVEEINRQGVRDYAAGIAERQRLIDTFYRQ